MEQFFNAAGRNDLVNVKEHVAGGININTTDNYGYSALHIASSKSLNEMAIFLINSGINPNIKDKNGQTVLHYAALYNQLDLAKVALEKGSSLSITDIYGNEPLWTAVFNDKGRNQRIDIVKLFLEYGANINHKNKAGKSPKDIVIIAGYNNLKLLMGA